ncbi:MAG: NUDIX domain-containing protein [Actinomycetota bacterium]|nr:NUDIX domain-containing protein [Actinomycetota bacterium]
MSRVRCVGAIVRDGRGRLLMVRRGHEPAAGTWSVPGGRVEPGESDVDAVVREVREETGLVVRVGALVGRVQRAGAHETVYDIHDYAAEVVAGRLCAATDAADARWVGEAEMAGLRCSPGLVDTLRAWGVLR